MKPIFGYGSPRFSLGNLEAIFGAHQAAGRVEFEPVVAEFEDLEGNLIEVFKGWRAILRLRLLNLKPLDYQAHLSLIQIINASKRMGHPLRCYPRYENGMNLPLDLIFKGRFGYEELTNLNAGQQIELEFTGKRLLSEIPGYVNLPSYLLIGEGAFLLLSPDGSRIILPEANYSEIILDDEQIQS